MYAQTVGDTIKCKRCNITLTYHEHDNKYKCHYCGYTETRENNKCKNCETGEYKQIGIGTESLEEKIKEMFPTATTIRMDLDTTKHKESHEKILKHGHENILERFKNGEADILIGTQMITKGHHFPNVTLSAVILADSMINFESYRAGEVAYQNIVQVIRKIW